MSKYREGEEETLREDDRYDDSLDSQMFRCNGCGQFGCEDPGCLERAAIRKVGDE